LSGVSNPGQAVWTRGNSTAGTFVARSTGMASKSGRNSISSRMAWKVAKRPGRRVERSIGASGSPISASAATGAFVGARTKRSVTSAGS